MELEALDINLLHAAIYVTILSIVVETVYQKSKLITHKKQVDWKDELFPVLIGIVVVWLFQPTNLFDYLPLFPRNEVARIVIAAIVVSRGANGAHDGYKSFSAFLESLIGRVMNRYGGG